MSVCLVNARMERITTCDSNKTFSFQENDTMTTDEEKRSGGKHLCRIKYAVVKTSSENSLQNSLARLLFAVCQLLTSLCIYKDVKEFKHPSIPKTVNETKIHFSRRNEKKPFFRCDEKGNSKDGYTHTFNLTVKQLVCPFHMKIIPNNSYHYLLYTFQQTTIEW